MPRTVLIIPNDGVVEDYLDDAIAAGADELALGIPPAWSAELEGVRLPHLYVEPDPDPVEVPPGPAPVEFVPMAWATAAQQQLDRQQLVIDALLLGGLDDGDGDLDDVLLDELPDDGGSLGDLDLGDLGTLPDSGDTLESLGSI